MRKKIKIFIIIVGIVIVAIIGANYFGGPKIPTSTGLSSSANNTGLSPITPTSTPGSNDFATALSSIKTIDIDTSIFSNPAYKMLRDFPVDLGTDIVGRNNPFAPVGTDQGDAIVLSSQSQTLQPSHVTSSAADFGAQVTLSDSTPATVVFEYGTSDRFGNASTPVTITKSGTAIFHVTGLIPETTYYIRAVLVQGANTTPANTMTFITSPSTTR